MKKFFTLALAACFGLAANAQDTSSWTNGQDVTDLIQWKAYDAAQEDPENPAWQGFNYGGPGEWEFRPAGTECLMSPPSMGDGNTNTNFICWGAYNLPQWDVYQEFEMPAGLYTVSVAGCYREGQTGVTFDLWAAGKKTENCFLYAKVGNDTYQTPMIYMFEGSQTEALTKFDSWMADCKFTHPKTGATIYGPSCHSGADNYIENGNYNGNEVTFVVPEKMTVRIGINKPVAMSQDQGWWNHWRMTYVRPYDEGAKAFVAYQNFEAKKAEYSDFCNTVADEYGVIGALMLDEVDPIGDDINANNCTMEEVNAALAKLEAVNAQNQVAYGKVRTMQYVVGICDGIVKCTEFAGKADFEAAIKTAKEVLADTEFKTYETIEQFIAQAEALGDARVKYLMSQEKAEDGSIDLTHAVSTPWFVNQEYTPTFNGSNYVFPEPIETDYFGGSAPGDECVNLENGKYGTEANNEPSWTEVMPYTISDQAHWSTDKSVENQWIYEDTWNGWHGGMQNYVMKLKGYAAWYSAWAAGANPTGEMSVRQVVTNLPDGFYTLEGRVFFSEESYEADGNEYMFIKDAEGNELAHVKATEPQGFWSFWDRNGWRTLTTDFTNIKGGKITLGYSHNTMAGNAGVVLKYYGTELDYSGLLQKKISENAPAEGELWPGDQKTYDAMIAKVVFPIAGEAAYTEGVALVNEAIAFKKAAAAGAKAYNPEKYNDLSNTYSEECVQTDILFTAWSTAVELGTGENDSYKDAEVANAIYNAYEGYLRTYDKADALATDELKAILKEQAADLKAAYANVDKLVAYEKALATPINKAIFANNGFDKATEAAPADVTSFLLANADLSEGPKTGWTCEGEDVNPSINTYGRGLAECWNQKPFTISQTLRSLPAGVYEFSVRACYRDAGTVDQAMIDRVAAGEGQNAFIFANNFSVEREEAIKPTAEAAWTEASFDKWYSAKQIADEVTVYGFAKDWDGELFLYPSEYESLVSLGLDADALLSIEEKTLTGDYPFDTKVGDGYYPASMAGFQQRCAKSPEAYCNKVQISIEEGGDIQFGLKKIAAESGDWLIYDDFKLLYLGATSTGISSVETEGDKTIYNVAGQRMNTLQKGINIVGGKKVLVK